MNRKTLKIPACPIDCFDMMKIFLSRQLESDQLTDLTQVTWRQEDLPGSLQWLTFTGRLDCAAARKRVTSATTLAQMRQILIQVWNAIPQDKAVWEEDVRLYCEHTGVQLATISSNLFCLLSKCLSVHVKTLLKYHSILCLWAHADLTQYPSNPNTFWGQYISSATAHGYKWGIIWKQKDQ